MPELPTPPGWPDRVPPPGTPGWEQRAAGWLLDAGPAWLRDQEEFWRQHPKLLARHVRFELEALLVELRRGYSSVRVDLKAAGLEPQTIDGMLAVYGAEGPRLVALLRQVQLVQDGLGGVRWRPGLTAPTGFQQTRSGESRRRGGMG